MKRGIFYILMGAIFSFVQVGWARGVTNSVPANDQIQAQLAQFESSQQQQGQLPSPPGVTGPTGTDCTADCKYYDPSNESTVISAACGTNTQGAQYESCVAGVHQGMKVQKDNCAAWSLAGTSGQFEEYDVIAYGVIAADCWAAAGLCSAGITAAVGQVVSYACTIADTAQGLVDTGYSIDLAAQSNNWLGVAAAAPGLISSGTAIWGIVQTAKQSGCTSIYFTAIGATLAALAHGGSLASDNSTRDNQCSTIKGMEGSGPSNSPNQGSSGPGGGMSAPGLASGGGNGSAGNNGVGSGSVSLPPGVNTNFPQGLISSSTGDPFAKLLNTLPNLSSMPSALKAMGTDLGQMANQLASQGAAATLGGMSGLPNGAADAIKELDQGLKDGSLKIKGLDTAGVMKGGGGGGGAGGKKSGNLNFGFGFGGGHMASTSKTESFSAHKKKDLGVLGDGDIWHSHWNGTIFQIISTKLEKARGSVEQLQWCSPLNRALAGLPSMPKHDETCLGAGGK